MIILAIDTSAAASVALVDGERVNVERTEFAARRHVEFVGPALADVFAEGPTPDVVVVGVGPGPFTGLRAGIAAGIGAGLGTSTPVLGVVSHDALALRALSDRDHGADRVLVATDARRREVYVSAYGGLDADGLPLLAGGPAPLLPADVARDLGLADDGPAGDGGAPGDDALVGDRRLGPGIRRVGRGFALYEDVLGPPEDADDPAALEPTAAWIARVAHRTLAAGRDLLPPEPLYLREPDAQPSARRTTPLT